MTYNHQKIEKEWQKKWEEDEIYRADNNLKKPASAPQDPELRRGKDNFYCLIEFPYPSGEGLHVGHPRSYTAMDIIARKKRMEGKNVLYPIGWDAFGLPTENYAIKTGVHPKIATEKNIENFTRQLKSLGFSFDWSREINTTDPEYYKWTQWMFLQFFKHGLAYKTKMAINWCLKCKIGLANEEVVNGKCERCGGEVEKRQKEQWMIKITKYAQRLIDDLDKVDYLPRIKDQQINWIGRSEGATVKFKVKSEKLKVDIEVFTTRPDTLFGATYMVLAPEHEIIPDLKSQISNLKEVDDYIEKSKRKSDLERTELQKEKTGVDLEGIKAINPVNNEEIPVWVADYVLTGYGTGAIMAVPAHDERDLEFAKKFNLQIKKVVQPPQVIPNSPFQAGASSGAIGNLQGDIESECFSGYGMSINSDFLSGLLTLDAKEKMTEWLEKNNVGKKTVNYKLRDWVFSRQRYWGEPIPLVHCEKCAEAKPKFLFLHAFKDSSGRVFWPWLKSELEKRGFEVFAPNLPNSNKPNLKEQTKFISENFNIDDKTIIVAHSLGGVLAMKMLAENNLKAKKIIMVAPPAKTEFKDGKKRPAVEEFCDWKFNYSKIKKAVGEVVVIADKEDSVVPIEQPKEIATELNAKFVEVVAPAPHFNCVEAPMILDNILTGDILNPGWVPYEDLPVKLPDVKKYEPIDSGESPLANMQDWINVKCPKCGGEAKRETDTMPNWAGSSWYFLRYTDPKNNKEFASAEALKNFMPVDWYNGGMEHTTLHLLYSRFWHKFLYDIGVIPKECGDEPYKKRTSHGMILGEGGEKMSKSRGNVINPDEMVKLYGADTLRVYEMFMGPFDQAIPWDTKGLVGCRRFLERVWKVKMKNEKLKVAVKNEKLLKELHRTIKKVGEDIEEMKFNTAIAQMMIFINAVGEEEIDVENWKLFLQILAPFAPHLAEELWANLGNKTSIHLEKWPEHDKSLIVDEEIELIVQINGKLRDKIKIKADLGEEEAKKIVLESEKVKNWIDGKKIKQVVFVKGKLMNIVI
ncbi:hypothetical protein A2316_03900 [Candidatus Falkowbacteria bacterium RIFOXYB2_FULL_38_15]|uniref:Leucine--tRNA ligase n=1 Tax=Candidatus Falkowbacteria bacterium RIFOXYA2_FULL_38_12 TaxID=1797993 RepID=A0A1F5S1W0_9BACT|nr:MAG: hypothetical protein A2257_01355 [Candidatus Falkowbacteria bacterium RIFOXYA2_FULL_38_12]OGF33201.1 MAG: hypothetical protein A2316_03900 [Candidatus Falkowbacteria bacterium RIFOXYB2_FULL_38_15]OGF42122.1 MAG: hypothetical protein A2555_03400 [Candidatus Falkowbacteria bacterium RIFOXYD2_FULL_39_16]